MQIEAESFNTLTARQKELAYWLTRAAIAIDPIIYDQNSRFGLRQKYLLELIVAHPKGIDAALLKSITSYTKLFWANDGNHNRPPLRNSCPISPYEQLRRAARIARSHAPAAMSEKSWRQSSLTCGLDSIPPSSRWRRPSSPKGGLDIIQSSSNNFYAPGVTLADLKDFAEKYPLNSRVGKGDDGKLSEEVYRAGTPDGSVKPGRTRDISATPSGTWRRPGRWRSPVSRRSSML